MRTSTTGTPDSVVPYADALARKAAAIRAAGLAKLQVIADFDGTLTLYWYEDSRGQRNEKYDAKREALFERYHPIEISPDIPLPEKAKLMVSWKNGEE